LGRGHLRGRKARAPQALTPYHHTLCTHPDGLHKPTHTTYHHGPKAKYPSGRWLRPGAQPPLPRGHRQTQGREVTPSSQGTPPGPLHIHPPRVPHPRRLTRRGRARGVCLEGRLPRTHSVRGPDPQPLALIGPGLRIRRRSQDSTMPTGSWQRPLLQPRSSCA
jgi:hypothetical protein